MPSIKAREATFVARHRDHQIFMDKPKPIMAGDTYLGTSAPEPIRFVNGQFKTTDERTIDYLRQRIQQGADLYELAPAAPSSSETLVRLATASAEETRVILDEELDGHNRPDVIAACEAKIAQFSTRGPKRTD